MPQGRYTHTHEKNQHGGLQTGAPTPETAIQNLDNPSTCCPFGCPGNEDNEVALYQIPKSVHRFPCLS